VPGDPGRQPLDVAGVAAQRPDAGQGPAPVGQLGQGVDQPVLVLAGSDRGHAEQPGRPVGAAGQRGHVHPRLGDVHPVRGQPVPGQPACGGRAGHHDRPGRPQGPPFPLVQLGRDVGSQPGLVGQRQVHQHGQPQPGRRRLDDLRHPAGDQAVQQHHGPVRRGGQQLGQPVRGRRFRPRPAPGQIPAVHPPAVGRAQLATDAQPVDVPPAGRQRVGHVARQHDENRSCVLRRAGTRLSTHKSRS
jgi:hypothetical protein